VVSANAGRTVSSELRNQQQIDEIVPETVGFTALAIASLGVYWGFEPSQPYWFTVR
jgi:hypothetical protein